MCLFFMFTLSINIAHMQYAAAILKVFFFFFSGIWEICALGALSAESSIERTSDAGSLSNSFIKLSGRISSKVR